MAVRRRARASELAARVAFVVVFAMSACQRTPPADPRASAAPEKGRAKHPLFEMPESIERSIAKAEKRSGERLSLDVMAHEDDAIFPAWLPDNRIVVPNANGASIVDPRSGATIPVAAKGQRAVVSPDGKILAIASPHSVHLVDVGSGQSFVSFRAVIDDSDERAIQFSPDGRLFAFPLDERPPSIEIAQARLAGPGGGAPDDAERTTGTIGVYDVAEKALRGELTLRTPARRLHALPGSLAPGSPDLTAKFAATPDPEDKVRSFELRGDRVVAGLASGATALWDARSLELLLVVAGAQDETGSRDHRPSLTEDGRLAAVWTAAETNPAKLKAQAAANKNKSGPGVIHAERRWLPLLVDALQGEVVMRLEDRQCVPFGLAMHPHEPLLAVGSLYPTYCVWDLAQRKVKQRIRISHATKDKAGAGLVLRLASKMSPKMDLPIEHLSFDPAGERLHIGIAHLGGVSVRLSDGAINEGPLSKDAHPVDFSSSAELATSPDRSMIARSGNEARVWDVASGRVLRRMAQHERHALLGWNEEAMTIVGSDGTLLRFRAATGELLERRARPAGFDDAKTVATDGGAFMIASSRATGLRASRIDAPGSVVSLAWPGAFDGVVSAAANTRASRLAVASSDQIVVFDAANGAALAAFVPHGSNPQESTAPTALALDETGQLLAAIVNDTPYVWDVGSRREIQLAPGDCTSLQFEPKSSRVVGACRDQVRMWDARTGAAVATADSGDLPEGVFFDVSGNRVAQIGTKFLTLRDGRTLESQVKTETTFPTGTAVFSPKGRVVAVALKNGEGVEFYRSADGKRLARLRLWPNDETWMVRSDDGKVEILGDAAGAKKDLECRVASDKFPLEACEERLLATGLLRDVLSEQVGDPR